jgi:hypothetical protein
MKYTFTKFKALKEMRTCTVCFILIFLLSLTANCQLDRHNSKSVLARFLENSFTGRYVGWQGNSNDSLRLDPIEYLDRIKSIDKSFQIMQGDIAFFVLSYSLDSIISFPDYSIGYVSIEDVANGYVLDRLIPRREVTNKRYLLIKKDENWFVLCETKDWFVSVSAYIKWAKNYLSDKTQPEGPEYTINVTNNLKDFKELIKTP